MVSLPCLPIPFYPWIFYLPSVALPYGSALPLTSTLRPCPVVMTMVTAAITEEAVPTAFWLLMSLLLRLLPLELPLQLVALPLLQLGWPIVQSQVFGSLGQQPAHCHNSSSATSQGSAGSCGSIFADHQGFSVAMAPRFSAQPATILHVSPRWWLSKMRTPPSFLLQCLCLP